MNKSKKTHINTLQPVVEERIKRENWGDNKDYQLPELDLTRLAINSYNDFLNKSLWSFIKEIARVDDFSGKNWTLEFLSYRFGVTKKTIKECFEKGLTYDIPLIVRAKLTNKRLGKSTEQEVFAGDIPKMTENGTFIINGIERVVINQLVRSPGVYFTYELGIKAGEEKTSKMHSAEIRPIRGSWLEFFVTKNGTIITKIDRKKKFAVTTLIRALNAGFSSDEEVVKLFEDVDKTGLIAGTIAKDPAKGGTDALFEIYRKMRPGEPLVIENAQAYFKNLFFNARRYDLGEVGRYKINKKLGKNTPITPDHYVLTPDDIIDTIKYLINLQNGVGKVDNIDHLGNRRIRMVGELVGQLAVRSGLLRLERMIKEKMSMLDNEMVPLPGVLINAKPVISLINEFFRTSQLSSILDQTNPLSEIDNLRRLTVLGVGGINRERASFSIRDINHSQFSKICPVRSPEGPNIGLVTYLALYAKVNQYGFLEGPYRKVVKEGSRMKATDEVVYLSADDEDKYYISHSQIGIDKNGFITDNRVPVRYDGEFIEVEKEKVQFVNVSPRQVVGVAASLIPFIAHDEANRALMGTHMQCQAVPLLLPESPVIGTGMEKDVVSALGRVIKARFDGMVKYVDASKVVIKISSKDAEKAKKNDKKTLELNYKIHADEETYFVEVFKRTAQSTCYSQKPLVFVGQKVKAGDAIIDSPSSQNCELALGTNLVIAYMSWNGLGYEDGIVISDRLVKDDSLTSVNIEEHEVEVVDTKLGSEELTKDIPNVGEEVLANLDESGIAIPGSEVKDGDILVGKVAPKGETELSAEERLLRAIFGEKAKEVRDTSLRMPHGERGIVIDVRVLDREKNDELNPGTNKKVIIRIAQMRKIVVGDKLAGRHGNKGVIAKIVSVADMPHMEDGTPIDIIIGPLSVLARMNLGQLFEAHLGLACRILNKKIAVPVFEKVAEEKIEEELKKAGLPVTGKMTLIDGRTGEPFERPIVVGIEYVMKLNHMIEDKTHARSTGPYSLVTQQPLGGKAQMGGQRLGEMEVWALEAHKAAYVLQEMLTIKSDDVIGRSKAFESIVKGADMPLSLIPESFKVLMKELNSLGLAVSPIEAVEVAQVKKEESAKEEIKEILPPEEKIEAKEVVTE
jgi:DNA-directed RNA polymerase subunit beta